MGLCIVFVFRAGRKIMSFFVFCSTFASSRGKLWVHVVFVLSDPKQEKKLLRGWRSHLLTMAYALTHFARVDCCGR